MSTVAYYISDYGYGHATRSIAVIRAWLQITATPYRIIVCSSDRILSFVESSLKNYSAYISYHTCVSDIGYVLEPGSIEPDFAAFRLKYISYVNMLPMEARREADFLLTNTVDLVISDISPIAFLAAQQAKIPSAGLSNFTWYTAYLPIMDRTSLKPLYDAYSSMDFYIRLEGADEPEWGKQGSVAAGFFCREIDWGEVSRIRETINPSNKKKIVYFAIGMSIDVYQLGQLKLWEDEAYVFIVSSNMKVKHRNITVIPHNYTESQNYLAASDHVITKPGWSTVSEAAVLRKPLILLHRNEMREDSNTIRSLDNKHPYLLTKWEQLVEGSIMNDTLECSSQFDIHRNDCRAGQVAAYLEKILRSGSL